MNGAVEAVADQALASGNIDGDGIYPWHWASWQRLSEAWRQQRLPHALLLAGPPQAGIERFADCLERLLLGAQLGPGGELLPNPRGLRLLAAGNHLDLLHVVPEQEGGTIRVAQIREACEWLRLSNPDGGPRVLRIAPADAMHRSACNSLLKTLEEPSPGAFLLLLCHRSSILPATLRSRCRHCNLAVRTPETAVAWLREQGPGPDGKLRPHWDALLAAQQGPLAVATERAGAFAALLPPRGRLLPSLADAWLEAGAARALLWFRGGLLLAIRHRLGDAERGPLAAAFAGLELCSLLRLYDKVVRNEASLSAVGGLQERSVLEEVLLFWRALACAGQTGTREG
ncbi:MAG: hypothetical protein OXU54_01735 [Gammaproteobacteria bacterium]|nr:hypothetical protein [Gammaproteobacteria bacterium]